MPGSHCFFGCQGWCGIEGPWDSGDSSGASGTWLEILLGLEHQELCERKCKDGRKWSLSLETDLDCGQVNRVGDLNRGAPRDSFTLGASLLGPRHIWETKPKPLPCGMVWVLLVCPLRVHMLEGWCPMWRH
jgi:hypothetical protein